MTAKVLYLRLDEELNEFVRAFAKRNGLTLSRAAAELVKAGRTKLTDDGFLEPRMLR